MNKQHIEHKTHNNNNITDKADVPIEDQDGRSYSDEKLIEIIDQSLQIMDKDLDGYVSFPEFVSTQESLKRAGAQWIRPNPLMIESSTYNTTQTKKKTHIFYDLKFTYINWLVSGTRGHSKRWQ